jgi:glycosyltransferase involved in cell wall biosynthesis
MTPPVVSIIIPVFSELDSLNQTVDQLLAGFADTPIEIIIIAHPNSGKACLENGQRLIEANACVYFDIQERLPGQGLAYRQAIDMSNGRFILLMNADLETDPSDARTLYDAISRNNDDLVIASRWCKGAFFEASSYGRGKIILNFLFQRICALMFKTHITDFSFCYKIARTDIFKTLQWVGTQHEFALESTLVPIALGMHVTEIPTSWRGREEGVSHFNFLSNVKHVRLALRIACYKILGRLSVKYGFVPSKCAVQ